MQQGQPPDSTQAPPQATSPSLGSEAGQTEDTFVVYVGDVGSAPAWQYVAKNALRSPDVPAVGEFRKAVEAALKQQQQQQKKTKP